MEAALARAVGTEAGLMNAAAKAPFLTREEERELAVLWKEQHDEAAMHRLTSAHMRLVIAIASRFRRYGLQMPDLIQEGHIGLLEAAARFDPEREVRFSTYATWWIRAAIQDHILRNWSIVRGGTSSAQKSLFFNLRRLRARLSRSHAEHGLSEIHSEIARSIGIAQKDVALMDARLSGADISLNAPVGDGDSQGLSERGDFLVDDAPLPDQIVSEAIDSERQTVWLRTALTVLNDRERKILSARRLAEDNVTLEALGSRLGISKERVRQIESRALEKVRRALVERHPQMQTNFS
jgi:RNA polymerase sigma-32 factor